MNDIDDLVRDFRATLPVVTLDSPDDIARRAAAQPTARGPRRRRLGVVVGSAATVGLVAVLGGLLVLSDPKSASEATSTARVDYGLEVELEVTPDPGVDPQMASRRLIAMIAARARNRDIAGLQMDPSDTGERVTLVIPGAKSSIDHMQLTSSFGLEVVDLNQAAASGATLADLAPAAAQSVTPETRYAYVPEGTQGSPAMMGTRAAIDGAASPRPSRGEMIALPEGERVVSAPTPGPGVLSVLPTYSLMTNAHALGSSDIADLKREDKRLIITVRDEARQRLFDAIQTASSNAPSRLALVQTFKFDLSQASVIGLVELTESPAGSSNLSVTSVAGPTGDLFRLLVEDGPPVPATVSVLSEERYGTIPPVAGEQVALPAWLERERRKVLDSTDPAETHEVLARDIVRVLSFDGSDGRQQLWAARSPTGDDVYWVDRDGEPGVSGACNPGAGTPTVISCGAIGGLNGWVHLGRAGPDVAAVTGRAPDGTTRSGVVRHGWYVVAGGPQDAQLQLVATRPDGTIVATSGARGWTFGTPSP